MQEKYRSKEVQKALQVANAIEWSGDTVVNFMTCHKAARSLSRYVEELESKLDKLYWPELQDERLT